MKNCPTFILSGTSSNSGKTTISLGLMAAFVQQGLRIAPFKCGPDFIDPGLHQLVTGKISRNLDPFMMGKSFTSSSFFQNSQHSDIAIIEGVMGMFDGGISSSAALARIIRCPNILVLDARSMAESAAAIIKGFEVLAKNMGVNIDGVILNRIGSDRHLQLIRNAIQKHCDVELLGYLPRDMEFTIPRRHLGLLTGDDAPLSKESIHYLADVITQHIDLDHILQLAETSSATQSAFPQPHKVAQSVRIAIARDKAFCFYYEDNFDLLRQAGAELLFFSPMTDTTIPEADALYLGGGYPELYADILSKNHSMIESIRNFISQNKPVFAECGGFMYLTKGITTGAGFFSLIGHFPVKAIMNKKRTSLGYREITTTTTSFFGEQGTVLRGHEFHYSHISPMPDTIERIFAVTQNGESKGKEGYRKRNVIGGYIHFHFGFSPQAITSFIAEAGS